MKPWLLMDIDGPLNPYHAKWHAHPSRYTDGWERTDWRGVRVAYNQRLGSLLGGLSALYDLVWCSGWVDEARDVYGPLIGLYDVPFIPLDHTYGITGRFCWKTEQIVQWLHDSPRPALWFDDECAKRDEKEIRERTHLPFRALRVSTVTGLTDDDFDVMITFGREHSALSTDSA